MVQYGFYLNSVKLTSAKRFISSLPGENRSFTFFILNFHRFDLTDWRINF